MLGTFDNSVTQGMTLSFQTLEISHFSIYTRFVLHV